MTWFKLSGDYCCEAEPDSSNSPSDSPDLDLMTALAHRNNIVCPTSSLRPLSAPSPENDLTPGVQIKHGKGQLRIFSKVLLRYLISKQACSYGGKWREANIAGLTFNTTSWIFLIEFSLKYLGQCWQWTVDWTGQL